MHQNRELYQKKGLNLAFFTYCTAKFFFSIYTYGIGINNIHLYSDYNKMLLQPSCSKLPYPTLYAMYIHIPIYQNTILRFMVESYL